MRPRVLRRRLTLAAFGAVLAGATIGVGIAKADPATDVAYLQALDELGVSYSNASAVIQLGHTICYGLSVGETRNDLIGIAISTGWTARDATYEVAAAVAAYCPLYAGTVLA